jgi:hypothetical protein
VHKGLLLYVSLTVFGLLLKISACNRTYYGEWGTTYSLSLNSATIAASMGHLREQHGHQGQPSGGGPSHTKKLPHYPHFVCQLTFAAAGDNFGDLVQVSEYINELLILMLCLMGN